MLLAIVAWQVGMRLRPTDAGALPVCEEPSVSFYFDIVIRVINGVIKSTKAVFKHSSNFKERESPLYLFIQILYPRARFTLGE